MLNNHLKQVEFVWQNVMEPLSIMLLTMTMTIAMLLLVMLLLVVVLIVTTSSRSFTARHWLAMATATIAGVSRRAVGTVAIASSDSFIHYWGRRCKGCRIYEADGIMLEGEPTTRKELLDGSEGKTWPRCVFGWV